MSSKRPSPLDGSFILDSSEVTATSGGVGFEVVATAAGATAGATAVVGVAALIGGVGLVADTALEDAVGLFSRIQPPFHVSGEITPPLHTTMLILFANTGHIHL